MPHLCGIQVDGNPQSVMPPRKWRHNALHEGRALARPSRCSCYVFFIHNATIIEEPSLLYHPHKPDIPLYAEY